MEAHRTIGRCESSDLDFRDVRVGSPEANTRCESSEFEFIDVRAGKGELRTLTSISADREFSHELSHRVGQYIIQIKYIINKNTV